MKHNTPTHASLSPDPKLSAEDDLLIYHLFPYAADYFSLGENKATC